MQKYNTYVIIEALCNADLHGVERKTYLKIIGLNVKRERIKKGFSQMELAYRCGKDQPSINRLERGRVNPTLFYLAEIAAGLEIEINALFDGVDISQFGDDQLNVK